MLLHDGATGRLIAVLNASPITEVRTAAVSAVATKLLARPDSRVVAIVGAGTQARAHVDAMRAVVPAAEIRVASRSPARLRAMAAATGVSIADSVEAAVRGADVVCTTTSSPQPVIERAWLAPGTHVNAVGAALPAARELDVDTIADAALFVDWRTSLFAESGEWIAAVEARDLRPEHVRAELGELIVGSAVGRVSADELTVFKSHGLAVEDLAAAALCVARARARRRRQPRVLNLVGAGCGRPGGLAVGAGSRTSPAAAGARHVIAATPPAARAQIRSGAPARSRRSGRTTPMVSSPPRPRCSALSGSPTCRRL